MEEETPSQAPAPSGFKWWLALIPILALTLFMWWMLGRKQAQEQAAEVSEAEAFNVEAVPDDEPAPAFPSSERYVSQAEREAQSRLASAGPGLSGFVPEKDKIFYKDPKEQEDDSRSREREMVMKYDHLVRAEQDRLKKITTRYRKKESIVREVDAAFGRMPRYMALKAQYERNRNPYDFVRGAVALPEVRKTVYKYATNGDVWRVTMGMMLEGLRQKPPKPVYDEVKRFLTEDKKVATFVTDLTGYLIPRTGSLLPQAIQPGQDLSALKTLASDLKVTGNMTNLSGAKTAVQRHQQSQPR
ncbi:MAG: hypothetical protein HY928_11465 [Elusimicrobia bacterium]|nr:hypothetical protein [Elusimicrobiota bacterium]